MAQLDKTKTIGKTDIERYLNERSDFSFEMKVFLEFQKLGFSGSHSGTYKDPVTNKTREFDIRLGRRFEGNKSLSLAVECKNLSHSYPLVIHCVPRKEDEAFHEILLGQKFRIPEGIHYIDTESNKDNYSGDSIPAIMKNIATVYKKGYLVGKSMDQVGIDTKNEIKTGDSDVYEKMAQAISSCNDLVRDAHYLDSNDKVVSILPILVIPDGSLWQIPYDETGNQIGEVEQVNHIQYFIGKNERYGYVSDKLGSFRPGNPMTGDPGGYTSLSNYVWHTISHLEIVTFSGIESLVSSYCRADEEYPAILPFGEHFLRASNNHSS